MVTGQPGVYFWQWAGLELHAGGTRGSEWATAIAGNAAVPCTSPSACEALPFPKDIMCPWVPAGSPATGTVTGSQLDTVVTLQGKAAWELQQKQVEEALYLQFAFKHNADRPLACPQLSQQTSHFHTGPTGLLEVAAPSPSSRTDRFWQGVKKVEAADLPPTPSALLRNQSWGFAWCAPTVVSTK